MKLQLQEISITFEHQKVLNNLSLDICEGEFVALIGPSGCGKSTLLNILAGVLAPESGKILVDDSPISGISSHFA